MNTNMKAVTVAAIKAKEELSMKSSGHGRPLTSSIRYNLTGWDKNLPDGTVRFLL